MSAFDSDITHIMRSAQRKSDPGNAALCDVGHVGGECVTHTGVGGQSDSTIRTLADVADTVYSQAIPPADQADQLQRWLSFLEPRFQCGERHSSTHTSWVFRGVELASGTAIAVKLLKDSRPELRNAFAAEALLLSQLEHPGIVRYMAHGELAEGGAYIVTEWLDGEELGARLGRGRLSVFDAITLITRAANVLAVAHARGVVHLDLKPSNLFLVGGDLANIRLLDFGIARLTRSVISDPDEDLVAGTPGYMAPEQVLGEVLSPATDVFALGCVLFRCLAGRRIFEGSPIDLMTRTVEEKVELPGSLLPEIHPALARLLASLLNPEPAQRPADAVRVLAAIAELPSDLLDGVAPAARALLSPSGLTVAERVPTTVVLVRHAAEDRATIASSIEGRKRYSSYFETLADGTWIALPRGNATALDQALHAARLTLDVRAHWPRAATAVVAGRTVDGASTPQLHELLAEAEARVASVRAGQIVLDESSAALVSAKFLLAEADARSALLLAERSPIDEEHPVGSAVCLGREAELASLLSIASDAFQASKARVVLLTGLAGIGKSSLLSEFLQRLSRLVEPAERPAVWSVYADPMSAGSALHLVSTLVEAAPGLASTVLLRLLNPDHPESLPAGELRPAGSVDAVHLALAEHVEAALARGPLLLCLEDIHWADLGSLRAMDYLLAALADRPLLIAATARPEVHELFPDLWQRRSVHDLRLSELSDADAERVVSLRLGQPLSSSRARIVQRARGNAFLLHELIRAEVEGRGEEVSETAQDVVQSRLRALAPDARRVLRAASILGDPFTPRGVTFLLGEGSDERDVERWLNLLVSREVLRRRDDGQPHKAVLVFAHAVMRDAAYDLLTESDRTLGHRLAAHWFESAERSNPTVTALHYARAGDTAGAGRWYFRAAMEAFKIGDFSATARSAEQALCNQLGEYERGHVLAVAAHAHRLLGNVERSTRLSADALRALPPNSPLWREAARTAMMAGASTGRHRDG